MTDEEKMTKALASMSGWATYTEDRQDKLRQYAGAIRDSQWNGGLAILKEAAALHEVKKELAEEGEFTDFLHTVYSQNYWQAAYERLELYERMRQKLSEEQIAWLAENLPALSRVQG